MSDPAINNRVVDFIQYKALRDDKQAANLLEAFENALRAKIAANPLQIMRDMAAMHDTLREIFEANRKPMPTAVHINPSTYVIPERDTINIRMADYERLQRLDAAIKAAKEKMYG